MSPPTSSPSGTRKKTRSEPLESDHGPWPERGFAPREAHKQKEQWTEQPGGRLRPPPNQKLRSQGGGTWGNQGFPHVFAHASLNLLPCPPLVEDLRDVAVRGAHCFVRGHVVSCHAREHLRNHPLREDLVDCRVRVAGVADVERVLLRDLVEDRVPAAKLVRIVGLLRQSDLHVRHRAREGR